MDKFQQDGYLVLENFLSSNEVEECKEAGLQLTDSIPPETSRTVFSTTDTQHTKDRYFLESGDKISHFFEAGALDSQGKLLVDKTIALNKVGHALHWLHPVFKKITFSEKIKETCWQLGMEEPVVVQSMYIYKNPGVGSEVIPHQDASFLHTVPDNKLVGFWFALDDATLQNGCLWFAPGSHKSGVHRRFVVNSDTTAQELLVYDRPAPCYPSSNFTPTPVSSGSCVLIHGQVVHKSEPNRSTQSRHAYTFHVIDMKDTTYSSDNWLQPNSDGFPPLYKN